MMLVVLTGTSAAITLAMVAILKPLFLRGALEAAGWLQATSEYHLSGVYDYSAERQLVFVFAAPIAGLLLVGYDERTSTIATQDGSQ
jgi:hypothetical protein